MFTLEPLISPRIKNTLKNKKRIFEWINAFGSPLNIIYPEAVIENILNFRKIFRLHKIKGEIFYAYKANKSKAILRELAISDKEIKVDVASEKELQEALSAGFPGKKIEATGPKNISFIRLALLHNVIMNINSLQELNIIIKLREKIKIKDPTPIFIRVKEFQSERISVIKKDTRLGLNIEEVKQAIKKIKEYQKLDFYGFSFHLTNKSEKERLIATEQLSKLTLEVIKEGLSPKGINIGGGFSINFLKNEKEWHDYISNLKESVINPKKPSLIWNRFGLGFWAEKGKIKGSAKFFDFYRPYNQFQELDKFLNSTISFFGKVSQFLQENMLTLFIEPGRSLLDQTGITLAKVISINKSIYGEKIIFLDMNRSHLGSFEQEFMSDPIVISSQKKEKVAKDGVFITGNLCLPHDFICRRKIFFKNNLCPNDILVFVNTAGYFMDFYESEAHHNPIAKKIAINSKGWSTDEKYEPNFE